MAQSLETIDEVAPHCGVVGYCQYNFSDRPASILEVGCGNGSLHERLKTYPYSRYLGIDASAEAILQAQARQGAATRFQQAQLDTFTSTERFDIILFGDALLTLSEPLRQLQRYEEMLSPGGLIVVSLDHAHRRASSVWRGIDQRYDLQDSIQIEHLPTRKTWTIKAMHLPEPGTERVDNARKLPSTWKRFKTWVYSLLPLSYRLEGLSPEAYDVSYRDGTQPDFFDAANVSRYALMAGYANFLFGERVRIFDVGCGPGVLRGRLRDMPYARYLGIDFSNAAIARIREPLEDERSRIEQADATTYSPQEKFDLILFGDALHDLVDPIGVLARYEQFLDSNGLFMVSMNTRNKRAPELWREIDARYKIFDQIRLDTFFNVNQFTIKLFRRV